MPLCARPISEFSTLRLSGLHVDCKAKICIFSRYVWLENSLGSEERLMR